MAYITIDYDDGKQSTYRAVELDLPGAGRTRFATGDAAVDHQNAYRRFFEYLADHGVMPDQGHLLGSSTMDHFPMDGRKYRYADVTLESIPCADGQSYDITVEALTRRTKKAR